MFYKVTQNNAITMIGKSYGAIPQTSEEITAEKYNQLMETIQNKTEDTVKTVYYLSSETETYTGRDTTHEEKVNWYVLAVINEQMTIDQVPTVYQEEIKAKLPQNTMGVPSTIYNTIRDITVDEIRQEVQNGIL